MVRTPIHPLSLDFMALPAMSSDRVQVAEHVKGAKQHGCVRALVMLP